MLMAQEQEGGPGKTNGFELTNLLIPKSEIHHGGPPRDGIPSIDDPQFSGADEAGFLQEKEEILGVEVNGIAKAYPIKILNYHEIVNDDFGGQAVVITYCPLCGSGMAFVAEIDGERRTFGVSGLLYNSDVLLYDRQTESLWSQIMSKAVSGAAAGKELEFIPTIRTTWGQWKDQHPDTKALNTQTGHRRNYDRTPYTGYEQSSRLMFPVDEESSALDRKERVLGVQLDGVAKAYPLSRLRQKGKVVEDQINGRQVKIKYDREANSAAVYDAKGEKIAAVTLYWFAWYAFHPDTEIFGE